MNKKIAHLSTAHGRNELRVHLKECNSLATQNYCVYYFVADGIGDEKIGNVNVIDIGKNGNRFIRMIFSPWIMLIKALKLKANLYHFHDPELLLIAPFLLLSKAKVIYDSHEDIPRSLLTRDWIPTVLKKPISSVFELLENTISKRLSGIIGATPYIANRFKILNKNTIAINNFPLQKEIEQLSKIEQSCPLVKNHAPSVCYIGGINKIRGIKEIINALEYNDVKLTLAGWFESDSIENEAHHTPGWKKVDFVGTVSRKEVSEILSSSIAGLVIFHPVPNHINAQPNKIFEYMAAGIPVIASNFPLWSKIIDEHQCGLCIDPMDPKAIAEAIQQINDNPSKARTMGENGRKAVLSQFNWGNEEKKLFSFYENILMKDTNE